MSCLLGSPLRLRDVTLSNRVAVSPMCQYSARDGFAGDYHFVHLGRFGLGGAGLVFTEATAVVPEGRITHGCLGLWQDEQIPGLHRITQFLKAHGTVPGIQLGHAGRKASMQRPWEGNGPLDESNFAQGERTWETMAPTAIPMDEGWLVPREMERADMERLIAAWVAAVGRAEEAGFEVIELHAAHGYLLHSFLSPISNRREDAYGGDREGRARFPLEVAEAVRKAWPAGKSLFVRLSSVDGIEGGWQLEDTVWLAGRLKEIGVDVIDCSSGGLAGSATAARVKRGPGFQLPFAETVRREADIATMAVGLILEARQAEAALAEGKADIIAIGRQALAHPNWALTAIGELEGDVPEGFQRWPQQAGWWLERRQRALIKN
ncbi:NADH:flavin oxidoreductase/NADH oxidase [Aquibaculum arenosum]|uniref:NADH:flavin oxidoreductase/NADH oxidase n=1 Tax=Aquibaculum arenosum TaxID=3032591 RepID=A0ABT5YPP9_9PROT|nr:NADH:flavin oxidoreductase/NADH oxidase [Fodinicurvata sp. CAU 1616]MDF2096923.1 NADH:flavin oxidoreductase/NADH oxidase [Fodinicurvata sp. CAU 1616]